jgi:hypothetical protein
MSSEKEKQKDAMSDLAQTLNGVIWWVGFGAMLIKIYEVSTKILQPLIIIAWLASILIGIWLESILWLKISVSIFLVVCILAAFASLAIGIYKMITKPSDKPVKKPALSVEASDYIIMSFIADKFNSDPAYRKKISDIYSSSQKASTENE